LTNPAGTSIVQGDAHFHQFGYPTDLRGSQSRHFSPSAADQVAEGFEVGQQLKTPVTWSAALGLKWRL
jgi:hypothetical protein